MTGNMVPTFSPHDTTRRRLRMLSNGNAVVTVGQINATDCERAYQAATQGKITSATVAVSPTTSDGVAYRADGSINYVSGRMMRQSSHTEGAVFDIRRDWESCCEGLCPSVDRTLFTLYRTRTHVMNFSGQRLHTTVYSCRWGPTSQKKPHMNVKSRYRLLYVC
jgi:hypothetical protein